MWTKWRFVRFSPGKFHRNFEAPSTRCDICWPTLMFMNIHGNGSMLDYFWTFYNIGEQCSTMSKGRPHGSIFVGQHVWTEIQRCCSTKITSCRRGLIFNLPSPLHCNCFISELNSGDFIFFCVFNVIFCLNNLMEEYNVVCVAEIYWKRGWVYGQGFTQQPAT